MKPLTTFGKKNICKGINKSSFKSKLFISSFIEMKKKLTIDSICCYFQFWGTRLI